MPIQKISIQTYIDIYTHCLTIDVRSEGEYAHAHIPSAKSLPIFNNTERATIGTIYKQKTREKAIKEGLQFFGPKLLPLLNVVEKWQDKNSDLPIVIHCARGGMRSSAVCWLLDLYGYNVLQITDGYKAFRNWALEQFTHNYSLKIIGGYTGSAKTEVLLQLQSQGVSCIDLEGLAHHKGSAFGAIDMPEQPSQEMFENKFALQLYTHRHNTILLEDESQRIGRVNIPHTFWPGLREAQVLFLQIPFAHRLAHIIDEYGVYATSDLQECIERIEKNLGGAEAKLALQYLADNDIHACFDILLKYYDKYYEKGLQKRGNWQTLKTTIECDDADEKINAVKILAHL